MPTSSDQKYMQLALELAAKAEGKTHPNPMVGAVVVRGGRIVGQGFHHRAGAPHAEILALASAGRKARGATLYVSLEPCRHTGRTPPCTKAIVAAGVRRVVAAMVDPNPKNRGQGLRFLRSYGVRTTVGILEEQARELNRVFITWMTLRRPFVTVKVAQSLDGKIATRTGESQWISGLPARRWAHRLRSSVDAILVGVGTILKDDPRLTVRGVKKIRDPIRVVLDSHLRTRADARLFSSSAPVIVATTRNSSKSREKKLRRSGAQVLRLPGAQGKVHLKALLRELARRGISHLLIEGGGEVIASAFEAKAVDRIHCVMAPTIIGGRTAPTAVEGKGISALHEAIRLEGISIERIGTDFLVKGDVYRNR